MKLWPREWCLVFFDSRCISNTSLIHCRLKPTLFTSLTCPKLFFSFTTDSPDAYRCCFFSKSTGFCFFYTVFSLRFRFYGRRKQERYCNRSCPSVRPFPLCVLNQLKFHLDFFARVCLITTDSRELKVGVIGQGQR